MKVAAYIRVSTTEQAEEGYSIAAQRNKLQAYATSQGWEIVQFYADEGVSAKDTERPELQRMLKAVKKEVFDCVLVYKLDRLTRSVRDLYNLLDTFEKHNIKFKSATEIYDTTTAIGRLFITLVSALAQWEREQLGERVSFGMQQKAKEGKWTVSTPPFGYVSNDSILSINPAEAAIIKEIYSLYLSGMGMWKISRNLNDRGIHSPKGKPWGQNSIHYILKNPVYIGNTRYNYRVNQEQYFECEGVVPAIISEDEFNLAQQMMESRKQVHPRQATSRYVFSKVLKCARCGATLIGHSSQTKRGNKVYHSYNYYCPNSKRSLCDLPKINENFVETKFIEILEQWDFTQESNEFMSNKTNASIEDTTDTKHQLENELKEIEKRRTKWQFAWVSEMISDLDFQKRMNEENEKEKLIQKELGKIHSKAIPTQDNRMVELLSDLKSSWAIMEKETKKQFILIAVQSMTVDKIHSNRTPDSIEIKDVRLN